MEFAFKCEMWALIRNEKFPKTHVLAILLTGNAWLFNGKKISCISGMNRLFQNFQIFGGVASHRINGKFTLNLCYTQVFKTKNSEISC